MAGGGGVRRAGEALGAEALGARGRRTLGRRAARAHDRRARAAGGLHRGRGRRGARSTGRPGRGLGVQLGQWAVHLVHSACFDPV